MRKESDSASWSRIVGTVSILLAVLWILSTLLISVYNFEITTFGPSPPPPNFHNDYETAVLLSSLVVVSSAAILVIALVFCKCNSLIARRYSLPILLASAVTLVFARAFSVAGACIILSINEIQLAGGIASISMVPYIGVFDWLANAIYVVAIILFVVCSFLMGDRTEVKEFYIVGVLFAIWLLIELASDSLSSIPSNFPWIYTPLAAYVIIPLLDGIFAASSFAVFGVTLQRSLTAGGLNTK